MEALLHTTWFDGWVTTPVGFTVIVKVLVGPTHEEPPLANVGVTTMVPVIGAVPVLVAVNDMLEFPLAPRPILVFVFVHA